MNALARESSAVAWWSDMAWATPAYPMVRVNAAGRMLGQRGIAALPHNELAIINNWRASHSFPLNTFQLDLRRKVRAVAVDGVVAQRTKRLESIHAKFVAQPTMRLIQMQDIGGCRAIVGTIDEVDELVHRYKSSTKFPHKYKNEKDYISEPKEDGYRSYHLIYQYQGREHTSCYNGLHVEIQLRTQLQHAWATAVEIVGTITKQALKSREGTPDWRRFFLLASGAFARLEGTPPVPGVPTDVDELVNEIKFLYQKLRVWDTIAGYRIALTRTGEAKTYAMYVLELDYDSRNIKWWGITKRRSQEGLELASDLERAVKPDQNKQVVLVSVGQLSQLRRAYPNYFMDIQYFADVLGEVMEGKFLAADSFNFLVDEPS